MYWFTSHSLLQTCFYLPTPPRQKIMQIPEDSPYCAGRRWANRFPTSGDGIEEKMAQTGAKGSQREGEGGLKKRNIIVSKELSEQPLRMMDQTQRFTEDRRKSQKNKFINKLKQFHGSTSSEMKTVPITYPPLSGCSSGLNDKKERNKVAARESRDRKKLYTDLMETKIERLQSELEETVKSIQETRLCIFSAEMRQGAKGQEANHRQMHIIKKLDGLLDNFSLEERNNEINICLDSIIYRIGALGKERKAALGKLYFDLLNFSQPALYRYILWSAVHKKHLFGTFEPEEDKWYQQIEPAALEAVEAAAVKGQDFKHIGEAISNHCHHFTKSAGDLVKFRADIEKKGDGLDNTFNEIREVLTPDQVANLILFVEKYQFKKEVRLFEEDNAEEMGRSRKKLKTQQTGL